MRQSCRYFLLVSSFLMSTIVSTQETSHELGGHVKGRLHGQSFPGNSAFRQLAGSTTGDIESNLRVNFQANKGSWSFDAAYQAFAGYGDRVADAGLFPAASGLPDDDRRLFDLNKSIDNDGKFVALHRLDRLAVGYTSSKTVVRFGRQALSWGNGLIYSPMDLVNPFDPAAIDTEYKAGDDMLYAQFLRENGDDLQFAYVFRRDVSSGDVEIDESTVALKYHGIAGDREFDVLLASNYGDATLAFGGNVGIGGAIWRGDIVYVNSDAGSRFQLVASLGYSWVWGGRNVSGLVEFFFDEFGADDDRYDTASLAQNDELLSRLARGQSFTIGRQYVSGALTIEMNPLWILTPTFFTNADDGSTLIQLVTRNNLADNMEFIGALNIPVGPDGSEYGGIELTMTNLYLSTDASVFAQLAWYF